MTCDEQRKAVVIVKRLHKAAEMGAEEFFHCTFWALERAGGSSTPFEIKTPQEMQKALAEKCRVLAVSSLPIEVPFAVYDVPAAARRLAIAGFLEMQVKTDGEFYRWALMKLQGRVRHEVYDYDFFEDLGKNFEEYFKHQINTENLVALEKHGRLATQFADLQKYAPSWCTFVKDNAFSVEPMSGTPSRVLADAQRAIDSRPKPTIVARLRAEIVKWCEETIIPHPFRALFVFLAVLVVGGKVGGCWLDHHREQVRLKAPLRELRVSIDIRPDKPRQEASWQVLKTEIGAVIASVVAEESREIGMAHAWVDDESFTTQVRAWEKMRGRLDAYARRSQGEVSCEISDNSITMIANTKRIKEYYLDVDQLCGESKTIMEAERIFGVRFAGSTRVGPVAIRTAKMQEIQNLLKAAKLTIVREDAGVLEIAADLGSLAGGVPQGLSREELVKRADAFWSTTAPEGFTAMAAELKALERRFEPYQDGVRDGFVAAAKVLSDLQADVTIHESNCAKFIADCSAPWLQFSKKRPADASAQMRVLRENLVRLGQLKLSVAQRLARTDFDAVIAEYRQRTKDPLVWGKKAIACHEVQQARIAAIRTIVNELAAARAAQNFSQIASFRERIEAADKTRLEASANEIAIGQYVASVCVKATYETMFGSMWMRQQVKRFELTVPNAKADLQIVVDGFASEIVRLYQSADLDKALNKGAAIARAIVDNHQTRNAKVMDGQGNEPAWIAEARAYLAALERAQRRQAQQR